MDEIRNMDDEGKGMKWGGARVSLAELREDERWRWRWQMVL